MFNRQRGGPAFGGTGGIGGFGGGGAPVSPDLIGLVAVVFVTFSLQFFDLTAIIPAALRLTPLVLRGFLWQLVTYPFIGFGNPDIWFLLELLILFWFGRDVFWRLGRRRFWSLVLWTAGWSAVVAVVVHLLATALGLFPGADAFTLMQGQRTLLTILIAAFATVAGEATILLFFVLPLKARWFLGLEILFAFMGFLATKDAAGFAGLVAAVAITFTSLSRGGLRRLVADSRLRLRRLILERRLARLRGQRRFDVIDGGRDDEWLH